MYSEMQQAISADLATELQQIAKEVEVVQRQLQVGCACMLRLQLMVHVLDLNTSTGALHLCLHRVMR